ncbi:MAG: glutamate-5-semialdehyde dehydrogenase, partial [Deltaproteobacteria bacterium]|nr:glutamate-5-semialdehyde dehydrogenase [Deltaproteobacteria bacterium]
MNVKTDVSKMARDAREASTMLAALDGNIKNRALLRMADELVSRAGALKKANGKDLEEAREKGLSPAMINRLALSDKVIKGMADGLREVAALPDPVGEISRMWRRPNGLLVGRMRIPLGVIGIIYESRPNVTADAAGLCLKSGNAVILRGGSEAINSNLVICNVLKEACATEGIPEAAIQIIPTTGRDEVLEMLKMDEYIDLIIPRGGEGLIRFVVENSRIPVIKHFKGVCHIFVDRSADLRMAEEVCLNAKVQRPGVCNAMETLLVHKDVAREFLPAMGKRFRDAGVELRGCEETRNILPYAKPASEDDWSAEYLDLILAVKVVEDLDEAVAHIGKYGSLHTESIITGDYGNARRFLREVK